MQIHEMYNRLAAPLVHRVRLMVARGVLRAVADSPRLQELQAELLAGELRGRLERFQDYGFTSHPHPGAEAVAVFPGGNRDHGLVIAVDDRRYRLRPLAQGEVAIYTDEDQDQDGCRIVLRRGNRVEIQARVIDLRGEERVHISGREVEIHADERLETDVAGYGEAVNHLGGTAWHKDTYHDGATVTATEHGIQPPEVE